MYPMKTLKDFADSGKNFLEWVLSCKEENSMYFFDSTIVTYILNNYSRVAITDRTWFDFYNKVSEVYEIEKDRFVYLYYITSHYFELPEFFPAQQLKEVYKVTDTVERWEPVPVGTFEF